MTNITVLKILESFNDLNDLGILDYIIKNKQSLTALGMEIAIDNDSVDLVFTKNLKEDGEPYIYTFDNYGEELLDLVFHSIGFKSDLV